MNKYRFTTREVIAVVISIAFYFAVEWVERSAIANNLVSVELLDWIRLRILVLTITAAIYGPVVAVISGVAGAIAVSSIFMGNIDYLEMALYGVYGYLVGLYSYKYHIREGQFRGLAILDYNMVQIFANLICSVMIAPLFKFLTEDMDLYTSIELGGKSALGSILMTGLLGTLILRLLSRHFGKYNIRK